MSLFQYFFFPWQPFYKDIIFLKAVAVEEYRFENFERDNIFNVLSLLCV